MWVSMKFIVWNRSHALHEAQQKALQENARMQDRIEAKASSPTKNLEILVAINC